MTTRKHNNIRQLALAYYRGWVTREKYIELRSGYLAEISAGKEPTPIKPSQFTPEKPTQSALSQSEDTGKSNNTLIITVLIILLVLVIGAILYLNNTEINQVAPTLTTNDSSSKPHAQNDTSSVNIPADQATNKPTLSPEENFLNYLNDSFIKSEDWKADSLNTLKLKWRSMTTEQQSVIRSSLLFTSFSRQLVDRIVQEQNLKNIVPSDYELGLITIAKSMGLLHLVPNE